MNAVLDFIRAAAPWIVIGVFMAVFVVINAAKNQENKYSDKQHNAGGKQA